MRVNTFLWWPNQGMIALATGQPCLKPGRLQHSFFFCFTSVYWDPSTLAQNQDHTKLQGCRNASVTRSPLELLTDIAGRGSRCPDSTDLSPPHRAALITEHRGRACTSPFSPFVKGFACFSLLNKLTEDYSLVLAGRKLSQWTYMHGCTGQGAVNPGGKECQGKRFWRSGKRMTWGGGRGEIFEAHKT